MALKRSSEIITVSTLCEQGTTAAFQVFPVDLQLNPLDQEVFVVVGVKIDMLSNIPQRAIPSPGISNSRDEVAVCTTRPSAMPDLSDSNVLAYQNRQLTTFADGSTPPVIQGMVLSETNASDTPDTNLEYIGIVATSDMFVAIDNLGSSHTATAAVRVYGYRAKADAATYAALVQSEVLSS